MFKELNTLKIFLNEPSKEFNVREAARILKISPATISKELKLFAKANILKFRQERRLQLYSANITSDQYLELKKYFNIFNLKKSGLIDELNGFYLKPTIVLFGSFSKGEDVEDSDIDLLILSEKKVLLNNLKKYEKKLGKSIQLFVHKSIKEIKNEHLINNILNGVVIQGSIKWI